MVPDGGVHFRVWAPRRRSVEIVLESEDGGSSERQTGSVRLEPQEDGYFSGHVAEATAGLLYRYRLDGTADRYPDPASRFQPQGPHGPSQVIDASRFHWTDGSWRGTPLPGQVLYEMHVGTFTRAGTWEAASRELAELAAVGITVVEVMPVADFPGQFGWGYDGSICLRPPGFTVNPTIFAVS